MGRRFRLGWFSIILLFALMTSAVFPTLAFADTSTAFAPNSPAVTPAPATQAPVVTDTSAPATQAAVATDTSAPATQASAATDTNVAPTDTTAPATTAAPTQAPAITDTPVPATTVAPTDVTPSATGDAKATAASTAAALAQVPSGTPVVVVDATGTVQPLATQAAATIIKTGDPIWCPAGQTPGGAGCTSGYSTVSNLITSGLASKTATDGTVYFESNYSTNDATFDGSTAALSAWANYKLTLQGGWNGSMGGSYTLSGVTTFSVPVTVTNWKNDVTVNDINISGTNTVGLHVDTNGNVKLKNVTSKNNKDTGAYINNSAGSGSVNITNGNFSSNNGEGLVVYSTGDVTLVDVTANINPGGFALGNGISVSSKGNITLNDVIADGNMANGALLDNTSGIGNINITSSTFDSNIGNSSTGADGRGLIAHSNGDITLADVTASSNAHGGAELDNTYGSGNISLSGNNTFNGNGFDLTPSVGLYAVSNDNITLSGVTALGNGYGLGGGAFLANGGDLSIMNSVFSQNCTNCALGFGFIALSMGSGDTSLDGVIANGNGNDPKNGYTGSATAVGALIFTDGNVSVTNSDFSGNCVLGDCAGGGIEVIGSGAASSVYFDHVTANGNGIAASGGGGALIFIGGNIDINCSTFNNNVGVGLQADVPSGHTITLNGVTLNDNTSGATNITGGGTLVSNTGNCSSGNKGTVGSGLSLNVINVTGGESNALDCTNYSGTELVLPNQDYALLPCPIGQNATINGKTFSNLPGAMDSKFSFVSGFDVEVTPSLTGGSITVGFKIPSGKEGANFTILHWDGSKWVSLGGSINPPGFFSVDTTLTGTFVLATQ